MKRDPWIHAPRTSRDVCRDHCAITPPERPSLGHKLIVPACIACLIALIFLVRSH